MPPDSPFRDLHDAPGWNAGVVLRDYRLAWRSRQCSLIGRKEVFSGKAKFGIFGKLTKSDVVLRDKDRIEIYRPLIADPKEERNIAEQNPEIVRRMTAELHAWQRSVERSLSGADY